MAGRCIKGCIIIRTWDVVQACWGDRRITCYLPTAAQSVQKIRNCKSHKRIWQSFSLLSENVNKSFSLAAFLQLLLYVSVWHGLLHVVLQRVSSKTNQQLLPATVPIHDAKPSSNPVQSAVGGHSVGVERTRGIWDRWEGVGVMRLTNAAIDVIRVYLCTAAVGRSWPKGAWSAQGRAGLDWVRLAAWQFWAAKCFRGLTQRTSRQTTNGAIEACQGHAYGMPCYRPFPAVSLYRTATKPLLLLPLLLSPLLSLLLAVLLPPVLPLPSPYHFPCPPCALYAAPVDIALFRWISHCCCICCFCSCCGCSCCRPLSYTSTQIERQMRHYIALVRTKKHSPKTMHK